MNKKEVFVDLICGLYIMLFLYAAFSKLADYEKFRVQLSQSPIITGIAVYVSWFIPVIEIVLAILLSFNQSRLFALYGSFSLMVMFTAYIAAILNLSDSVPCSCGGVLETMSWEEHLLFNFFFVALAATAIWLNSANASIKHSIAQSESGKTENL